MKFSWVTVFGLMALAAAVAAEALVIRSESQMRSSQLALMQETSAKAAAENRELAGERDRLLVEIEERAKEVEAVNLELADEKGTHDPLRRQILQMNAKDHEIARDMERLREELNKTSSALEAEKAKSSEASSSFEQRARDLEKEIGGLKEQLAALRKELDDGRKEIQRLSDLKAGLEQANIKIKAESSAELESLRKKNDALAAEKSGLAEQVKSLEAKLAEKPATPAPAQ